MNYKLFSLIIMMVFITGCTMAPTGPTVTVSQGVRIFSTTADQQSTLMKDHDSTERFCLARGADVADTESAGIGATVGLKSNSDNLSEGSSRGAIDLGGRNPAVLITRELMYRTCEIIMNLNLTKEESLKLYSQTLNASITISQNQTSSGVAAISGNALPEVITKDSDSTNDDDDDDDN